MLDVKLWQLLRNATDEQLKQLAAEHNTMWPHPQGLVGLMADINEQRYPEQTRNLQAWIR